MQLATEDSAPPRPDLLRPAAVPFALGLLLTAGCYWAAVPSLGLWLGGLVVVALLVPALTLAEEGWLDRIIAGGSVVDGVAVVWLVAVFTSETGFVDWLRCYVLLAAWAAAVWSIAILLERVRMGRVAAAAVTVVLALAWLTWPVWISPWLTGPRAAAVVDALVPVHPPMVINGALRHLGIWTQHPVAYRLTSLGQDIAYALPLGIGRSALLHVLIAGAAVAVARARPRPAGTST
jgi:hypothetical protein